MRPAALLALLLLSCSQGLKGQYFVKGELKYRVAELDPHEWRKVGFAENDLAWVAPGGQLLAMNSTCHDYGDPPLEVLTNHLLMGFTDKTLSERKSYLLDGREALESSYDAKLDGVPVDLTVVVLKKDGCVYDFSYIAPAGHGAEHRASLDALLDGFTTTLGAPSGRQALVRLGPPTVRPEEPEPEAKAQ